MKSSGKPKQLGISGGVLNFFTNAVNMGKGVIRTTSDSMAGRRITSAKGSIFANDEASIKRFVLARKNKLLKPGCGVKEIARRAKQIANLQHEGTFRSQRILAR